MWGTNLLEINALFIQGRFSPNKLGLSREDAESGGLEDVGKSLVYLPVHPLTLGSSAQRDFAV